MDRRVQYFGAVYASIIVMFATSLAGEPVITSVAVLGTTADVTLSIQVGQPYNASLVEKDLRRLWSLRRFSDIRVETSERDGGTAVVFRILEAPDLRLRE